MLRLLAVRAVRQSTVLCTATQRGIATTLPRLQAAHEEDEGPEDTTPPGEVPVIRADAGVLISWGQGSDGQLGHQSIESKGLINRQSEVYPRAISGMKGMRFVEVACGKEHAAAVTEDGELYTWGKGEYMQLGHGDAKDVATPRKVDGLVGMKVVQVACGDFHTAAVGNEGQLWTWGWGGSMFSGAGGLGHGKKQHEPRPTLVEDLVNSNAFVKQVACGEQHTVMLDSAGDVWSWGNGEYGILGTGSSRDQKHPEPIDYLCELTECKQVAAGHQHSVALSTDGTVYTWGSNARGQLGLGAGLGPDMHSMQAFPKPVDSLQEPVVHVAAGHSHTVALTESGKVFMWGGGLYLEPQEIMALSDKNVLQLAAGHKFTVALTGDGAVWAWGSGRAGQLGIGAKAYRPQPQFVSALKQQPIRRIACGYAFTLAIAGLPTSSPSHIEE